MKKTEKYFIHKAALESDYESALMLIKLKVDLNQLDSKGHTALHWAVFTGDVNFVKILLEAGANPNIFSSDGVTPKWRARDFGLVEIDNLLESFGGKILTNKDFNRTAFSVFNKIIGQSLPEENATEEYYQPKKYNLPKGYSFFQTALKSVEFLNDPIKFISKSMEVYSDSYTASLKRNKKIIITQNPEFINYILKENHKNYKKSKLSTESAARFFGKGLLFSNGEYWLRQRRLIQPAFHKEKLQGLINIIIKSIDDFLITFPTGESIDICPIIHRLSFNILIKSLFDINLSPGIMDEISEIFSDLLEFLIKDTNQPFRRLLYPITGEKNDSFKKAKRLREIIGDIVSQRKSETQHFSDLLDMLLNSKYEDTGASLSEEQIIDELLIIIFAGHETTANSISWLLYLLSYNTEKLQKLTATLKEINILDSVNNEYVRACISEGMRLYPAAWMTERVSITDDQFGEFTFPKNTIIIPFFFGLHRNKNNWEDELQFKPERFIADPTIYKSKNYFPFGAGPRMCIGNNFALTEMSFFLHLFLNKFEIKSTGQTPEMKPLITLRPDKIILNIKKNNSGTFY